MIQRYIISLAIGFFLRQLQRWQDSIDWALVKEDLDVRIRALVPGEWLDSEAVTLVHLLVDTAAAVLSSTLAIEQIVTLLVAKDFQGAWTMLRGLILDSWKPESESEKIMYAYVTELETIA